MFAYCLNNPGNNRDDNGMWTITVGSGISGTCFVGASASKSITFDKNGITYQYSTSSPKERETTTVGLFSAGHAYTIQYTNKEDASGLEGISSYLGFSLGRYGLDLVSDAPMADLDGELVGVQVALGTISGGVDVHAAQTRTVSTKFISWENVWKRIASKIGF